MSSITATVESIEQATELLSVGVDCLYIGNEEYGLRMPKSFNQAEIREIIALAHQNGKKVSVAVNGIMHQAKMDQILPYLKFLYDAQADQITVGDPGVIQLLRQHEINIPYIYDGATLVTSSRQINFWGRQGAIGAVLAREIPFEELAVIQPELAIFAEVQVYGATCIHHSKRPLLHNYFSYMVKDESVTKDRGLYLSEPKEDQTHYSIYEDQHGTHIFANNDLNLMPVIEQLYQTGLVDWKLDGMYTPGDSFVKIVSAFVAAKEALQAGELDVAKLEQLNQMVQANHPAERGLDTGFYHYHADDIK